MKRRIFLFYSIYLSYDKLENVRSRKDKLLLKMDAKKMNIDFEDLKLGDRLRIVLNKEDKIRVIIMDF